MSVWFEAVSPVSGGEGDTHEPPVEGMVIGTPSSSEMMRNNAKRKSGVVAWYYDLGTQERAVGVREW